MAFSSAMTCASVSTRPSWALLASSALSRFFMVSRSCRCHTQRTPAGETVSPRFLSSLATRTRPKADCSTASGNNGVLVLLRHPVLDAASYCYLQQSKVPAFVAKLLEAKKPSRLKPIILQASFTLPSCFASSSSPTFARMIFCSVSHGVLQCAEAGSNSPWRTRTPLSD